MTATATAQRPPARRAVPRPGPVYGIADLAALGGLAPAAAAAAMARAGVSWVQLRAKGIDDAELHRHALACRRALAGADGVHVGQDDLPPAAARRVVGPGAWIGRSTHDREQLLAADRDPEVDVIAVGPVFPTRGKDRPDPVVGLDFVRWARAATAKPLVAIGGIDETNLAAVLAAGADAAAVLSAVCGTRGREGGRTDRAAEVEANAARLVAAAREVERS